MDILIHAIDILCASPVIQLWPDAQALLKRVAAQNPRYWKLPGIACEAVGGTIEQAVPAVAAIACLQISILLIDDLLDDDPRGEYRTLGVPAAANLAEAFQAAGLSAIIHSASASPSTKLAALRSLSLAALTTALGQHLDAQNPADEAAYWRVVETKSTPFFSAALHIGALLGGAPAEMAEQVRQFGCLYGEMIQIHDDLNDSLAVPANPDWRLGRASLPILFAQTVDHPDQARFLELRRDVTVPEALAEAQNILIRCGAVSYGVHQLLCRYQIAQKALRAMRLVHRAGLEALLEEQIRPIQELFQATGVSQPNTWEEINENSEAWRIGVWALTSNRSEITPH